MKKRIISFILVMVFAITSLNLSLASSAATQEAGNLLYGMTATANSEYYNGWHPANRPISSLTDGKTFVGVGYNLGNTFMSPRSTGGEAYANFAFAEEKTLNKVVVYFPGTSAVSAGQQVRDYAVDVRLSDGSWKRVAEKHNAERTNWDAFSDTLCFAPVTCTELRLTSRGALSIYEIEAYNDSTITSENYTPITSWDYTENAISMPAYADLMNNVTFTANEAYYNGWFPDNRPLSKLNDGKNYVSVGYNTSETATIPMDSDGIGYINASFPVLTKVNKVVVYLAGTSGGSNNVIRDFIIEGKLADGTWKRVAEKHLEKWTNWDAKEVTMCFEAVSVTDMRMTICSFGAGFLYEMDAYHINTQTTSENTPFDEPNIGDVNADDKLDILDLIRYKKYISGTDNSVKVFRFNSDINKPELFMSP